MCQCKFQTFLFSLKKPFPNAGARQPGLQVPEFSLQQRGDGEGGQAVHGRQRDQSGGEPASVPARAASETLYLCFHVPQVGGTTSQKVWVFTLEEEDPGSQGIVTDLLVKMTRPRLIIMTMVLICQIFKLQVTDVDDKADKVHSCNGTSCEVAAAF